MTKIYPAILFLMLYTSCQDTITVIKGCCEMPPVISTFKDAQIWVPNAFSPNGDGLHDRLYFMSNDNVIDIAELVIKNADGTIVFKDEHFPPNDYDRSWDGKFNGKVQRGMYSYFVRAETIEGYVWEFNGKVCNCPCDDESDKNIVPMKNCIFEYCDSPGPHCFPAEYGPCFAN
jgi:hypothetical protein